MQRSIRSIIILSFVIVVSAVVVVVTNAQETTCDIDRSFIVETVGEVCTNIGENEACYANFEVTAIPQENSPEFAFAQPGDNADLAYIRSLFLSALSETDDRWGIAQLRLLARRAHGSEDIILLLFGDVEVENQVGNTLSFPVQLANTSGLNVRSSASPNAQVVDSISSEDDILAVARLADSSWIRVVNQNSGIMGWSAANFLTPLGDQRFADLPEQASTQPYYGPMQAMIYRSGEGAGACGTVQSDGMLIQTPQGVARVSLLINEVSVELISSPQYGATAFVTSNPNEGMTLSMLTGAATVEANGTQFFVDANTQTTIGIGANGTANSQPSVPTTYDVESLSNLSLLPLVVNADTPLGTNAVRAVPPGANNNGDAGSTATNVATTESSGNGSAPPQDAPPQNTGGGNPPADSGGTNSSDDGNGNGNGNANGIGNGNGNANGVGNGNGNQNGVGTGNANNNGNKNGNSNG